MHPAVAKKLLPGDRIRFRDDRNNVVGMVEGIGALGVNVQWENGATDSLPLKSSCWDNISFVRGGELISMHIIKRTPTPDGMWRYVVNPDSDAWRVRPVVGIEAARSARSLVATINGRERDSLPACGAQEFPTSHLTKQA